MKRLFLIFLCLFLLTGCTGESADPAKDDFGLEVEYGESGITALWADTTDPVEILADIPYLNAARPSELQLNFGSAPDSFTVHYRTDADGYTARTEAVIPGTVLPAPTDGAAYLFEITAKWEQREQTFYFRFLPQGEGAQEASPLLIPQLKPSDLFGVIVVSNKHQAEKTCRSTADVTAILDFLRDRLATDFVPAKAPVPETDYILRLAMTDGSQLTLGYIPDGSQAWLLIGGVPYEVTPMDFDGLWDQLETEAVPFQTLPEGDYLQITDQYPDETWGNDLRYGYLRAMDSDLTYDEVLWIEDTETPTGFRLENGEKGLALPLAEDCQFWYLADHNSPCCQVTREQLLDHVTTAGWDILLRLYVKDGSIVAVCEQFLP